MEAEHSGTKEFHAVMVSFQKYGEKIKEKNLEKKNTAES